MPSSKLTPEVKEQRKALRRIKDWGFIPAGQESVIIRELAAAYSRGLARGVNGAHQGDLKSEELLTLREMLKHGR